MTTDNKKFSNTARVSVSRTPVIIPGAVLDLTTGELATPNGQKTSFCVLRGEGGMLVPIPGSQLDLQLNGDLGRFEATNWTEFARANNLRHGASDMAAPYGACQIFPMSDPPRAQRVLFVSRKEVGVAEYGRTLSAKAAVGEPFTAVEEKDLQLIRACSRMAAISERSAITAQDVARQASSHNSSFGFLRKEDGIQRPRPMMFFDLALGLRTSSVMRLESFQIKILDRYYTLGERETFQDGNGQERERTNWVGWLSNLPFMVQRGMVAQVLVGRTAQEGIGNEVFYVESAPDYKVERLDRQLLVQEGVVAIATLKQVLKERESKALKERQTINSGVRGASALIIGVK